jgi:hypothetical protein
VAPAPPLRLTLRRSAPAELVEAVAARAADGRGWINLAPDLGDDHPPTSGGGWFSGRGPTVPHATYVAARAGRRGRVTPAQVGIEHGSGPQAVARLAEAGHPLPAGWRVRQDHPRRGLVAEVGPDTDPGRVVEWLLGAAAVLSGVPTGDVWLAEVWEG